jgi:hypothetical protein
MSGHPGQVPQEHDDLNQRLFQMIVVLIIFLNKDYKISGIGNAVNK